MMMTTGYDHAEIVSFCQTVQGEKHIVKGQPCEDASDCWSSDSGQVHIAVVSDGHGSPACFRSATGAKFAVESAMDHLRNFVAPLERDPDGKDNFLAQFVSEKIQAETVRRLIDVIINDWYEKVEQDMADNPITEEVLSENPCEESDMASYEKGENLVHIYGATLLVAVYTPDYLILIQKGDGHCVVFYEDGTVCEPIPWDDRCQEYLTTSLSQPDAAETTQFRVISMQEHPLAACFLGCDGVEDSFADVDMEGTYSFYRELCIALIEDDKDNFDNKILPEKLRNLTENGSGDDVSVAAIVNVKALKDLKDSFTCQTESYNLQKRYHKSKERNEPMKKKLDFLQRKVDEKEQEIRDLASSSCDTDDYEYQDEKIKKERVELEARQKDLSKYQEEYNKHMKEYKELEEELQTFNQQHKDVELSNGDEPILGSDFDAGNESVEKKIDQASHIDTDEPDHNDEPVKKSDDEGEGKTRKEEKKRSQKKTTGRYNRRNRPLKLESIRGKTRQRR